jgi:hypothetical protein
MNCFYLKTKTESGLRYCVFQIIENRTMDNVQNTIIVLIYHRHKLPKEERSIFWKDMLSVILSENLFMYMCPIPNGFRDTAVSLYSSSVSTPKTVLPFRMWISVKRQLAFVTADSDIVGMLWKYRTSSERPNMLISCPHKSCKMHRCWRWNFRKCIILSKLYTTLWLEQ